MAKAERLVGVVVGVPRAFVAAGRAGAVGVREEGRALGVTVRGLGAREVEEAEARVDGAVLVGVLVVEVVTGLAVREVNSALVLFAGVDTGTTFTKSFGGMGGYIAGSKEMISFLRQKCAASACHNSLSPVVCQQIISSFKVRTKTMILTNASLKYENIHNVF